MRSQFQATPGFVFDSRRAAWFPNERVLAVADLHLGYAWAHRLSGQLMPILPMNDTIRRLTNVFYSIRFGRRQLPGEEQKDLEATVQGLEPILDNRHTH